MIRYSLRCQAGHGFDGWFRSSADFDAQAERGLLECPACGSSDIAKALMAPALATGKAAPAAEAKPVAEAPAATDGVALVDEKQQKIRSMLRELRQHLTRNSEDVGERFPEVARKMHTEEIEHRSIYGKATADEAKALIEDGVAVQPLPVFPDEMN